MKYQIHEIHFQWKLRACLITTASYFRTPSQVYRSYTLKYLCESVSCTITLKHPSLRRRYFTQIANITLSPCKVMALVTRRGRKPHLSSKATFPALAIITGEVQPRSWWARQAHRESVWIPIYLLWYMITRFIKFPSSTIVDYQSGTLQSWQPECVRVARPTTGSSYPEIAVAHMRDMLRSLLKKHDWQYNITRQFVLPAFLFIHRMILQ